MSSDYSPVPVSTGTENPSSLVHLNSGKSIIGKGLKGYTLWQRERFWEEESTAHLWPRIVFLVVNACAIALATIYVLFVDPRRIDVLVWFAGATIPFWAYLIPLWWIFQRHTVGLNRLILFWALGVGSFILALILEIVLVNILWGIVAVFDIPVKEWFYNTFFDMFAAFIAGFLVAALMEEFSKFVVASIATIPQKKWLPDTPWGTMLLGLTGTLTMATVENCEYVLRSITSGMGLLNMFMEVGMRDLLSVPLHATTGVFLGSAVAYLRFARKASFLRVWMWAPVLLILPVLLHGFFDWSLMFLYAYFLAKVSSDVVPNMYSLLVMLFPMLGMVFGICLQAFCFVKIWALQRQWEEAAQSVRSPQADLETADPDGFLNDQL